MNIMSIWLYSTNYCVIQTLYLIIGLINAQRDDINQTDLKFENR